MRLKNDQTLCLNPPKSISTTVISDQSKLTLTVIEPIDNALLVSVDIKIETQTIKFATLTLKIETFRGKHYSCWNRFLDINHLVQ